MKSILIKAFDNEFKVEPVNKEIIKELFILLENNRENLHGLQLYASLIDSYNEYEKMLLEAPAACAVYKNNQLIGSMNIFKWGKHDEISFWLDKDSRDNKVFAELLAIFVKTYIHKSKSELVVWAVRSKAVVSKNIAKKIGFKSLFRYNSKLDEFDTKKVIPAIFFYKQFAPEINTLSLSELKDKTLFNDLSTFCIDLTDYTFKRNNFYINTSNYGYYYWSGMDVYEDLKEVYFINVAKAKGVYKKFIKKILMVEDYKTLYNQCKTIFIVYNRIINTFSIMFLLEGKRYYWIHFDNAII